MDNIECLKKFTEDVVKKQNDSVEALKKLSQAIDTVDSDVANLINSLQMVGNRQFAENRIHEDDSLTGGGLSSGSPPSSLVTSPATNQQKSKRLSPQSHSSRPRSLGKSDDVQLSLCDILHKAIELLPPREDEGEEVWEGEEEIEVANIIGVVEQELHSRFGIRHEPI